MLSWKQCALPVITTMALWQTHALGHMITGRVHFFVITYYTHLASVRFDHSVCCGSLMTTYMCVYISEHYVWKITMVPTFISLISFALFARSFEDGQNHLLPPVSSLGSRNLRLIQTQRKLKGGWSYQVFVLLCSKKRQALQVTMFGASMKWYCLTTEICLSTHKSQIVKFQEHLVDYQNWKKINNLWWSCFLKAQRKLGRLFGLVLCFKRYMFVFTALDKGNILSCTEDSWE